MVEEILCHEMLDGLDVAGLEDGLVELRDEVACGLGHDFLRVRGRDAGWRPWSMNKSLRKCKTDLCWQIKFAILQSCTGMILGSYWRFIARAPWLVPGNSCT